MARPQAVATGLYVSTPEHLIPDIAALVRIDEPPLSTSTYYDDRKTAIAVVDACCGEGIAVELLCGELAARNERVSVKAYACELEATRAKEAEGRIKWGLYRGGFAEGDAFCLRADPAPGAGVMLSNPPYNDKDAHVRGRLEVRFIRRTIGLLAPRGVLLLIVPHYSLADMIDPLAWELDDARCFRFPDADFGVYKQVLLVGKKRSRLLRPDELTERQLRQWAADASTCEPWERTGAWVGAYAAPQIPAHASAFAQWEIAPLDLTAMAAATGPWRRTTRAGRPERIATVYPPAGGLALLRRRFPVVTPLKPAYIAAAIACGLFDGEVVRPDDPTRGLPDVLVRGVFARDFVTVDEKVNADGAVVGEVQVQRPRLEVTGLDMTTGAYVALRSTAERTETCSTIGDFLALYGQDLLRVMRANCPVLHDPTRDEAFELPAPHAFPLFPAQADAVRAMLKLTHPRFAAERAAWLAGGLEEAYEHERRGNERAGCRDSDVARGGARAAKTTRVRVQHARRGGAAISRAKRAAQDRVTVDRPPIPLFIGELGAGKCLGLGTLVLMYDGRRVPVEDVRAGDLLMGPDSTPRRVLSTTRGVGPLYRVRPVVGDPWVCNDVHLLTLVHTESGDVIDIEARDYASSEKRLRMRLSKGNRTTHPKVAFKQFFPENGVEFPARAAPTLDPYFLGAWYGDGTKVSSVTGRIACVAISKPDPEIRTLVHEMAARYGLHVRESTNSSGCPTFSIAHGPGCHANPLLNALREVYGDGERLPAACLLGTREVRLAFLAGLLDTDGYLSNNTFEIAQKRRLWADGICFLAHSLGIRATMREKIVNGVSYWRVMLSGELSQVPNRLPRKKATPRVLTRGPCILDPTALRNHRRVSRTGISLEAIGDGEYAGFTIDGDGRFLLGDFTVTHNTVQSLILSRAYGAKSVLVLCPPHLVERNWPAEVVKALGPEVRQTTLDSITAIDALASAPPVEFQVAILSRESAKLGHARASVGRMSCPACGAAVPMGDLAAKRARCEAPLPRRPYVEEDGRHDPAAAVLLDLARALLPVAPHKSSIAQFVEGRASERRYAAIIKRFARIGGGEATPDDTAWSARCGIEARRACADAFRRIIGLRRVDPRAALRLALAVDSEPMLWEALADGLREDRNGGWEATTVLRQAASLLSAERAVELELWGVGSGNGHELAPTAAVELLRERSACGHVAVVNGERRFDNRPLGDIEHAIVAVDLLISAARWERTRVCGEPLWQAVPDPRRVPLADYISARHPRLFDFFIRDEAHEHSAGDSAQTGASEKLMALIGRGVDLSGSACSGYAESLFTGSRARDPRFREMFARGEEREFVRQYGFVKRIASDVDKETGKIVAYGSVSDKVERSYRITGNAPGVLPLFLLDHLLRSSVPLHKADLGLSLPPHTEQHVPVALPADLAASFSKLILKTVDEIKRTRWKKGLAGKLWGALGELVSFPDMCTSDVTPGGVYEVRYPPGTVEGEEADRVDRKRPKKARLEELGPGPLVCSAPTLPASAILPKEKAMLEHVEQALRAGERVLIYPRHVELMPRLARLIERELGEPCPVLYASKPDGAARSSPVRVVGAGERQAWIESEVVAKNRRVLVVNPVAVKTGLNVLTWFSRAWWHENPNCDALTGRQANGRIDRIGKTRATLSLYPTAGDLQEKAYRLWMHKIAVSLAVDGLDPGSALALAGLDGEADAMDGVSVGRQLFALLEKKDR